MRTTAEQLAPAVGLTAACRALGVAVHRCIDIGSHLCRPRADHTGIRRARWRRRSGRR